MKILIKGAGDLATGIAYILHHKEHDILMTEIPVPLTVRRSVAMSGAVYEGKAEVQGMTGILVKNLSETLKAQKEGRVAVIVDESAEISKSYKPEVIVDAILAKRNLGTSIKDAPLVIAAGPGFTAGRDCHCVIETKRGNTLGNIIWQGSALFNTGVPGEIAGYSKERLIRASKDGVVEPAVSIGDMVEKGQIVAYTGKREVRACMSGIVRGMLQPGVQVTEGLKIGDIDARGDKNLCVTISDKALCIGEGVLRAIKMWQGRQAIVLMAAGEGKRFGSNKLLAELDGKPLYIHAMDMLKGFPDVLKVVTAGEQKILKEASDREFAVIVNEKPQLGISYSVKLGLKACMERISGLQSVMFMVCDQPRLTKESVQKLLEVSSACPGHIICAAVNGENKNPVVWDKKYWTELLAITGDTGGKQIIKHHREEVVQIEVNREEVKDIDRETDLAECKGQ